VSKCTRACITDKLDHSNTAIPFPLDFDHCELPGPLCHQPNLLRRSSPRPARSAGAQQSVCAQLNACAAADRQPTSACSRSRPHRSPRRDLVPRQPSPHPAATTKWPAQLCGYSPKHPRRWPGSRRGNGFDRPYNNGSSSRRSGGRSGGISRYGVFGVAGPGGVGRMGAPGPNVGPWPL
jgi:hypothetical protein